MSKATIIKDKLSGVPFAVLFGTGNKLKVYGALGQGQVWANWIMSLPSDNDPLLNLDVSLVIEQGLEISPEYIETLVPSFDPFDINGIKATANERPFLIFEESKSAEEEIPKKYQRINMENQEEEVERLPISDVLLASIDISYKHIAVNYKAKAFNLDMNKASLLLQVKGARAMWDPNMPGGGGWRCPETTPYGGQFTNRLGTGCTFGVVRRIGKKLMASSLRDMADGDTQNNLKFPSVYKAGKKLDATGEKIDKSQSEKLARRVARRAAKLQKQTAKTRLTAGRPTFQQRYESLSSEGFSRQNRIRIASFQTARDILDDKVTEGFVAEARKNRRAGKVKDKSPKVDTDPTGLTGSMSNPSNLSPAEKFRQRRELLAEKLRNASSDILEGRRISRKKNKKGSKPNKETLDFETDIAFQIYPSSQPYIARTLNPELVPFRAESGDEQRKPNIVSRFFEGSSNQANRVQTAVTREIRGQRPRSTDKRQVRIVKRQRRRAKTKNNELTERSDYPEYAKSKINPPALPGDRFTQYAGRIIDDSGKANVFIPGSVRLAPSLDAEKTRRRFRLELKDNTIDNILLAITPDIEMSSVEAAPVTKETTKGLDSLDKFFHYEMSHIGIALARESSLSDFDKENQKKLKKLYLDWLMSLNNPDKENLDGMPSNMGLATQIQQIIIGPGEPSFRNADILMQWKRRDADSRDGTGLVTNNFGSRNILRLETMPGQPIIYLEDTDAMVAHVMTPDGRHLLSIVTKDPSQDSPEDKELFFIAGEAAIEDIISEKLKPRPIDKLFRKNVRSRRQTASLDRTKNQEVSKKIWAQIRSDTDGLVIAKTSSGAYLSIDPDYPTTPKTNFLETSPDGKALKSRLMAEININIEFLDKKLRTNLKFPDINEPIDVQEARKRIEEVVKTDARFAAILQYDLHNFVSLAKAIDKDDVMYINDLKPQLRQNIINIATNERDPNTNVIIGKNIGDKFVITPLNTSARRIYVPHDERRARFPDLYRTTRSLDSPSDYALAKIMPIMVEKEKSSLTGVVDTPKTGPLLSPNIGNPDLGIIAEGDLFLDTATGEYVEDLSNLTVERSTIYDDKAPYKPSSDIYPRVAVSPIGVFPTRYVSLAPGADPTLFKESSTVARTFKDAIDAFSFSGILARARRGRTGPLSSLAANNARQDQLKVKSNILAFIDTSNIVPTPLVVSDGVRNLLMTEIQGIASDAVDKNPNLPLGILGPSYVDYSGDSLGDLLVINSNLGINPAQIGGMFYIPSEALDDSRYGIPEYITRINLQLALQTDFEQQLEMTKDSNSASVRESIDLQRKELLRTWADTTELLVDMLQTSQLANYDALAMLDVNSKNEAALRYYLDSGQIVDNVKMMIDRHVIANPIALEAIVVRKKQVLEEKAKLANVRKKRAALRLAQRENRGTPRSEGAFDGNPEILDVHGSSSPPLVPRDAETIIDLSNQHRAEGLFDIPEPTYSLFSEEQIDALAAIQEVFRKAKAAENGNGDGNNRTEFTGLPGTPMYGVDSFSGSGLAVGAAALAHFWFYNGGFSLPVLISQEEFLKMVSTGFQDPHSGELIPNAIPMTRGIRMPTTAQNEAAVQAALRGDRFVPYQGSQMVGKGEYWSINPANYTNYHGTKGTINGVITPSTRLFQKSLFGKLFPEKDGMLYEVQWDFYNAIGAPGSQGVNLSHGNIVRDSIPVNSIMPDPKTNQFTPEQISKLEEVADGLTKITDGTISRYNPRTSSRNRTPPVIFNDAWGRLTIEGMSRDRSYNITDDIMFQDIQNPNSSVAAETQELRVRMNAWYGQHLSWFIQLAQMRRDESAPGQAGVENKLYNLRLTDAMRSLMYMDTESRASMLGIDAFSADSVEENNIVTSRLYSALARGENGDRILVLNRSAMIYSRELFTPRIAGTQMEAIPNDGPWIPPVRRRSWMHT